MTSTLLAILGKVGGYLSTIKWTKLKISILLHIVLSLLIVFLLIAGKEIKAKVIIKDKIVEIPGKQGEIEYKDNFIPYPVENPVNSDLLEKYNNLKNEFEKEKLYKEAITVNEYNEIYEDSTVKIDIYSKVQGKLLKQAPKYFIKPYPLIIRDTITQTIIYPSTNKLLGGIEVGIPFEGEYDPIIKGSLYHQNKKDNL